MGKTIQLLRCINNMGGQMLKEGDRSPSLVARTHDDRSVNIGAPGRRTVLWFSPKGGIIDEIGDRLIPAVSP